jgi:hypothetical protein
MRMSGNLSAVRRTKRPIAALGVIAVMTLGPAACGGSSDETVARVAGVGTVTRGAVEHWIPIEARLAYSVVPKRPVPDGVVPVPPAYTACIAYLMTHGQKLVETGPKPTTAQLKSKCAQQYQQLKQTVLGLLITWDWTIGTGAAAGMKASDAEVRQRLESIAKNDLVGVPFNRYLQYTGQTLADMLLRSRVSLFEEKFRQGLVAMAKLLPKGMTDQERRAAVAKLAAGLPTEQQWVARTSCSPGYVTSSCRQYKGPLQPGFPN